MLNCRDAYRYFPVPHLAACGKGEYKKGVDYLLLIDEAERRVWLREDDRMLTEK